MILEGTGRGEFLNVYRGDISGSEGDRHCDGGTEQQIASKMIFQRFVDTEIEK